LNSNHEVNSNFLDPQSFVRTQIILGLEFKIIGIESLNQSSNSHFWRSSNFGLEFKIHSNLFKFIQIGAKIFKKDLKAFPKSPSQFDPTDPFILASSSFWPRSPARPSPLPGLKTIWPSRPKPCWPALAASAFPVYTFPLPKHTQQKCHPRSPCFPARLAQVAHDLVSHLRSRRRRLPAM
jgi:hypothetical protein